MRVAGAEGPFQPGPGAHLLPLDAVVLRGHQEELGSEVAAQVAGAAEPVQEREHELRVLGHRQGPVQGLCQRGWAEGPRGQPSSQGSPACRFGGRAEGALLLSRD